MSNELSEAIGASPLLVGRQFASGLCQRVGRSHSDLLLCAIVAQAPARGSTRHGRLPEWPKGADCKSAGIAYVGSNPTPATSKIIRPCRDSVSTTAIIA